MSVIDDGVPGGGYPSGMGFKSEKLRKLIRKTAEITRKKQLRKSKKNPKSA